MSRLALLLLLLARAEAAGGPENQKYYYADVLTPFFVKDAQAGLWRSQRPGSEPSSFTIQKDPASFRVFFVGGSIAARSMSAGVVLERLSRALPTKRIESLNCGMGGYDSYREALVLEEILRYEPDLVVLLTGHNEMIGSPPVPLWILRAGGLLSRLPVLEGLFRSAQARRRPSENISRAQASLGYEAFASNLRMMIRRAKARGVPIVVASPPLNYRDAPTGMNYILSYPPLIPGWIAYLRRDYETSLKEWKKAFLVLGQTTEDERVRSLAFFHMGRAAEALGRQEAANRYYQDALAADWLTKGRCGPKCQEIIRQTSLSEGAIWLDLDAAFRRAAAPRLPGLDMFDDEVHWLHRYDALAAWTIIEALRRQPRLAALAWDERGLAPLRRAAEHPPGSAQDETLETLRYAVCAMSRPDDTLSARPLVFLNEVFERRPRWFADVEDLAHRAADGSEAGGAFSAIPPIRSFLPRLYWYVGEIYLEHHDYKRSLTCFSQALSLDPRLQGVLISRGIAQAFMGDVEGAKRSLKRLIAGREVMYPARAAGLALGLGDLVPSPRRVLAVIKPPKPPPPSPREARFWIEKAAVAARRLDRAVAVQALERGRSLASTREERRSVALGYQQLGEYRQAIRILEGLAQDNPGDATLLNDLGVCLYLAGAAEQAIVKLRRAVALKPRLLSAVLTLGSVYTALGRFDEALELYDSALAASRKTGPLREEILRSRREVLSLRRPPSAPPGR